MAMELTFREAEFVAGILQKSLEAFSTMELCDIIAVAAFCNKDIPEAKEEAVKEGLSFYLQEMAELRERIRENYGI